jgi:hypothetical protein
MNLQPEKLVGYDIPAHSQVSNVQWEL